MTRLPEVYGDTDHWGQILLEFLRVGHNENGTLKSTVVGGLLANAVLFANGSGVLTQDLEFVYNPSSDTLTVTNISSGGTITVTNFTSGNVNITGGSIGGITDLAVADGGTGASTAANARTNLGLGTIATQASANVSITGGAITGITDLAVADGGTGASTAVGARGNLGAAPLDPSFITLGTNSELTNERVLTAGSNVTLTDAGAGSTLTVAALEAGTLSADLGPSGTAVRAKDTVYQNTSGKMRRVWIVTRGNNNADADGSLRVENANPPTVNLCSRSAGFVGVVGEPSQETWFGMVPSSWYYKVVTGSYTLNIVTWREMDE